MASICFKHGPPKLIGAELEWLVHHASDAHCPLEAGQLAAALGPYAPTTLAPTSPALPLPHGSTVTVEPGGQLEISSPPRPSLSELIHTVDGDAATLAARLEPAGLVLVHRGADPDRPPQRILDLPRYAAMEAAFDRVGPLGRTMMSATAAVQVCVDAGTEAEVAARWATLHDMGPALLAAFANSPRVTGRRTGWVSNRMRAWFGLDPPRTRPRTPAPNPSADYARWALDVPLLCRRSDGRRWDVPAGVTFADWLSGAMPDCPTFDDLDYHLTTLFPPVRPHGHIEVRYLDAQPSGQWAVPVAVVNALLTDPAVMDAVREACAPVRHRWLVAAREGLADRQLAAAAAALFELACRRLPTLQAPAWLLALVEDVTERRVRHGCCPADVNEKR